MKTIQDAKEQVALLARRGFEQKLFAGTSGNLSVFVPEAGLMLITPTSVRYEGMTAEDIVSLRLDGTQVEGRYAPSSEWRMHAALYESDARIGAVVHTHSPYATAFAAVGREIPHILIEMTAFLGGSVPCAAFAPPGSRELGLSAVEALANGRSGCLLRSHGVVAVGSDLEQAYLRAEYIEDAAVICHHACQLGRPAEL